MSTLARSETYFAIPSHYTIGDEFPSLAEALVEVSRRIEQIRVENVSHDSLVPERLHVDERVREDSGDRPIRRYTIEATQMRFSS